MKIVLLKYISFVLLYISTVWLLKYSVDYYIPDKRINSKFEYFNSNLESYNTLVIGSSHVDRHFDTSVFDEITRLSSFNFGHAYMGLLESIYILEQLIDNTNLNRLKYVVLHLDGNVFYINKENLTTERTRYPLDFENYITAVSYFFEKKKYDQIANYTNAYLSNILGIGQIKKLSSNLFSKGKSLNTLYSKNNGFFPHPSISGHKKNIPKGLHFLKDVHFSSPKSTLPKSFSDKLIINILKKLDNKLEQHNVRLILLIPSNKLIHLKLSDVEELEYIYMGDGTDFKDYFRVAYRYNLGHLNHIGAEVYTRRFSQKFKELIY